MSKKYWKKNKRNKKNSKGKLKRVDNVKIKTRKDTQKMKML